MNIRTYAPFMCIAFFAGILFLALQYELIIIRYPSYKSSTHAWTQVSARKKNITLIVWHHHAWHTTTENILLSDNEQEALATLITTWLHTMQEQNKTTGKVVVHNALLGIENRELYLSLDKNPLPTNSSIFEQWMWIEALFKTLHAYNKNIQRVQLLINHQPLNEYFDFSRPWPITGFLNS